MVKILSWSGETLFDSDKPTLKESLQDAVLQDAHLRGAHLQGADLRGAHLQDADLQDADLRGAHLRDADLQDADLRGAHLRDADLRDAEKTLEPFFNLCARDILYVFHYCAAEVPFLREKLMKGEVDGTQYEGECACLIGSLANADGGLEKVCSAIPFYNRGLENYGEQWFWNIRKGDTPENSYFCKKAVELCDQFLGTKKTVRRKR